MSSRRILAAKIDGYSVVVGWDNPMMTYFAQVERPPAGADNDDTIVLWLGSRPREYLRPEEMVEPLAPYGALDAETLAALRADRIADLDRGPTPLQRASHDRFGGTRK